MRLVSVLAVAVLAGATAGVLPAVVGRTVAVVSGVGGAAPPGPMARVFAAVNPGSAWALVLLTLAVTAFAVAIGVVSSRLASSLAGDLTAALRIELMRRVVHISARALGQVGKALTEPRRPPGEPGPPAKAAAAHGMPAGEAQRAAVVQLAVSREAALVADFAVSVATTLPQAVATLVVLAAELLLGGAWVVLVGGGALFAASRLLAERATRRVATARRELQTADAAVFGHLQETLGALEDLRLWGAREQAIAEFATRSHACADARRSFASSMAVAGQVKSVFGAMSPLLVVLALQLGSRHVDAGTVAKLLLLVPLLTGRLEVLDGVRLGFVERGPVLDATLELLALESSPSRADGARRMDAEGCSGELVFEDVSYTPPGAVKPVLDGISLRIPAGSVVGVCGPSGSGKSTLLRLVLRLDDPDAGRILLDGVDVRSLEPEQLPELFGVLRQSAQLLERSVRANLSVGMDPVPSDDAMRSTLDTLALSEFATATGPRGLHTVVKKSPPNISGGETRRLLLARMMLGGSRVQLLDEPEAGLPSATAEDLLAAVTREAGGRTHVVVTHAPHLLRSAFNVVLRDGKLVGTGTHDELAATNDVYRALLADALKSRS